MNVSAYDCFLASFRAQAAREGHGVQVRLARTLGKTPKHINDVLKGRSRAGQTLQESIAAFFGMSYEDMLGDGRQRLTTGGSSSRRPFPYAGEAAAFAARSDDRAAFIYQKAGEEAGLRGIRFFSERALKHATPPGWDDYAAGMIDDAGLYELARKEVARMMALIERHFASSVKNRS